MWIAHRHMNVEIGNRGRAIPFLGIHKWDFRRSAQGSEGGSTRARAGTCF
jgi:hypothetical protein